MLLTGAVVSVAGGYGERNAAYSDQSTAYDALQYAEGVAKYDYGEQSNAYDALQYAEGVAKYHYGEQSNGYDALQYAEGVSKYDYGEHFTASATCFLTIIGNMEGT